MPDRPQLGKILLEAQIIKKEDIDKALSEQKRTGARFGEALVNLGIIAGEDINWGLANQLDLPFIRIRSESIDPAAVALVPEMLARKYTMVPFFLSGEELTVVIDDPFKTRAIAELQAATGCLVKLAIGLSEEINHTIDVVYESAKQMDLNARPITSGLFVESEVDALAADTSAEALLHGILVKALERKATAIHLEPREDEAVIRLRIEGQIEIYGKLSTGWFQALSSKLRTLSVIPGETGVHTEGFLSQNIGGKRLAFHVSFVRGRMGPAITLVNISCPDFPDDLDSLPMSGTERAAVEKLVSGRSGSVMVVGAEKMEKLKFIYLLLRKKSAEMKKTFAIGHMPWFEDESFIQIRSRTDDPVEYLQALKMVISQDPDIIYIEDCWDRKVMSLALQSSMMHCFVFANINLRSVLSSMEFLIESIESRTLLTESVKGMVGVAAPRRLCPNCKKPEDRHALASQVLGIPRTVAETSGIMRAGDGCASCGQSGRNGLLPAIEILPFDEKLVHLVKSCRDFEEIREKILASGHVTLDARLRKLVLDGEIGLEEFRTREQS
jgi:type IV pilus assembly protein PilB